ncbi:hypothetical protein [Nocardia gipuzkoensis]
MSQRKIVLCFLVWVRLLRSTPKTERVKDEWDTAVFGFHGVLRFGAITSATKAASWWSPRAQLGPGRFGDRSLGLPDAFAPDLLRLAVTDVVVGYS